MSNTSAVNGTHDEFKLPTSCLKPESKHHRNNNTLRSADFSQFVWPLTVSNRYAALSKLSESPLNKEDAVLEENTRPAMISSNDIKMKMNQRGVKNFISFHLFHLQADPNQQDIECVNITIMFKSSPESSQ
jgi:hypothetical protein